MTPISHFIISWDIAVAGDLEKKDRWLVSLAGIAADFDGLGIIAELTTKNTGHPLYWWTDYHHIISHNILAALIVAGLCYSLGRRRWKSALMALVTFHVHLFCDLIGARGPDGYQWPIPYLLPFSDVWQWAWDGQWLLTAWQNIAITGVAILFALYLAYRKGYSPLELLGKKVDLVIVKTLRNRFGHKEESISLSAESL